MSFSLNNPLILGDTNAPIKKEIGNLEDLDTTDKSSLVNALNEAIDNTLNGASRSLDNLSTTGTQKLRSLNAYANEGELLTDAEGLNDVKSYVHSTFDKSKFTVVGSPNITDDGIASGFITSNSYLSKILNLTNVSKLELTFAFSCQALSSTYQYLFTFRKNATNGYAEAAIENDGTLSFGANVTSNITLNQIYYLKFKFDNGTKTYYYSLDNKNWTLVTTSTSTSTTIDPTAIYIGGAWQGIYASTNCSIDLKQFSITVDGVPVFSGNKTGIDTIKPDDYTVVGTPTISADGVASGFSINNSTSILTPSINFGSSLILKIKFKLDSISYYQSLLGKIGANNASITMNVLTDGSLRCAIKDNSFASVASLNSSSGLVVANVWYTVKIVWTGTVYQLFLKTDNTGYTQVTEDVSSTTAPKTGQLRLGADKSDVNYGLVNGSIDLNAFKIYVDGNLVYQPCLKIPYTESKTGSKIVDSIYRDRVNDMATQFGYANYHTLDEDNGNFTLPQVELYGLIGQRTLRDSYRNGATYWELWSDRTLEIGGTCTSGVEYNLPRSFTSATDYILSVPYSAKTASSFTPTASGDFIAKGLGVL